jgi:hypothetical protein
MRECEEEECVASTTGDDRNRDTKERSTGPRTRTDAADTLRCEAAWPLSRLDGQANADATEGVGQPIEHRLRLGLS